MNNSFYSTNINRKNKTNRMKRQNLRKKESYFKLKLMKRSKTFKSKQINLQVPSTTKTHSSFAIYITVAKLKMKMPSS